MESSLVREARLLAEQVFADPVFGQLPFHNLEHTREVVDAVKEIGAYTELTGEEMDAALAAAWLHDTGYIAGAADHERESAALGKELFQRLDTPVGIETMITNAILSTHMPQQPRSMVDKVLCDADLAHLAGPTCQDRSDLLRIELRDRGELYTDEEWTARTVAFMQQHRYHTSYGEKVLEEGKRKNIKRIRKPAVSLPENSDEPSPGSRMPGNDEPRVKAGKEKRARKSDAALPTLRHATENMVMLNHTTGMKASILLAVSTMVLMVVFTALLAGSDRNPYLFYVAAAVAAVCLPTMVLCILANRVSLQSRKSSANEEGDGAGAMSLLDQQAVEFDTYRRQLSRVLDRGDEQFAVAARDVYYLKKILQKSSYYLGAAYNLFMYGSVAVAVVFGVAWWLGRNNNF